jgi:hypothetical protein
MDDVEEAFLRPLCIWDMPDVEDASSELLGMTRLRERVFMDFFQSLSPGSRMNSIMDDSVRRDQSTIVARSNTIAPQDCTVTVKGLNITHPAFVGFSMRRSRHTQELIDAAALQNDVFPICDWDLNKPCRDKENAPKRARDCFVAFAGWVSEPLVCAACWNWLAAGSSISKENACDSMANLRT